MLSFYPYTTFIKVQFLFHCSFIHMKQNNPIRRSVSKTTQANEGSLIIIRSE